MHMHKTLTYEQFNYYVGRVIAYAQTIEYDLKWLYAIILAGDPEVNMLQIKTWTLGKTVIELKALEVTLSKQFFKDEDFDLLRDITAQRNYISHEIYQSFLYEPNWISSKNYLKASERLLKFYEKLEKLHSQIEKYRLRLAKEKYDALKNSSL